MKLTKENIKEYAQKYNKRYTGTNDESTEKEMKEWLKNNKYLDREKFIKIGLWKTKRAKRKYESNNDLTVREITKFSLTTKSEEARIKSLLALNGVSYPVASVILHFAFPERYSIVDFRAIWSLGWQQPSYYTFDFWQKYCEKIKSISKETGESIRTIDKALWAYSKEKQLK